ncbi:MAG: hypothetical protein V7782_00995 [Psychromonas sp.]
MEIINQTITLNGRDYNLEDSGEGPSCLLISHQHCCSPFTLLPMVEHMRKSYRLIILDITDHLPADSNLISDMQLKELIDDLHLLCDIYWLDKVRVLSDYQPDIIQAKFKRDLFERYQAPHKWLSPHLSDECDYPISSTS